MTNQTEKLERWLNAYLDGALSPTDAARFESVIERNPKLRELIESQHDIEASLKRSFNPPRQAPQIPSEPARESISIAEHKADAVAEKPRRKSRGFLKGLAMAAMLAIVAYGAYWGWENQSIFTGKGIRMARFYEQSKASDFKEDWKCDSEQQFQTTFWYRLGSAVAIAGRLPSDVEVHGIKYGHTLSDQSVHLTATVDGKGIVVFVDKKENDRKDDVSGAGLHAFRKETDHLVLVEVSPFDKPRLLDLLSEKDIPQKWKDEMDIPTKKADG